MHDGQQEHGADDGKQHDQKSIHQRPANNAAPHRGTTCTDSGFLVHERGEVLSFAARRSILDDDVRVATTTAVLPLCFIMCVIA